MKLCHKTPVSSSTCLTYTVMLTVSSSIMGRLVDSHGAKSLRVSRNLVKPQSLSSFVNLWCALWWEKMVGSFGFHRTSANWTQQLQSSGISFASKPCSKYIDTWSTLLPNGNNSIRLHSNVSACLEFLPISLDHTKESLQLGR